MTLKAPLGHRGTFVVHLNYTHCYLPIFIQLQDYNVEVQ